MNTRDAAQHLISECAKIEGCRIECDGSEADIYWMSLHVTCDPKDVPRTLAAIRTLDDVGAVFE